jgi:acyl-CoA hydrolase
LTVTHRTWYRHPVMAARNDDDPTKRRARRAATRARFDETSPPAGTPRASRVETAQVVLPGLTNVHGTIFGGILMSWIDGAAGIAAARHAAGLVVTASMDRLHFLRPVQLGEVVVVQAQVNFAARSSMEIGVRVFSENPITKQRIQATRAYLTFVSVDERGQPRQVAPLRPETADERRRFRDAQKRRAVRLRERRAMNARHGS